MRVDSRSGKCGFMIFKCSLVRNAENEIWRCLIKTPNDSLLDDTSNCFQLKSTASNDLMIVLGIFRIFLE